MDRRTFPRYRYLLVLDTRHGQERVVLGHVTQGEAAACARLLLCVRDGTRGTITCLNPPVPEVVPAARARALEP